MSEEDLNLSNNMKKLEIENISSKKEDDRKHTHNPFMRRRSKSLSSINFGTCDCSKNVQNIKHTTSFKRTNRKILRDPVFKYVKLNHSGEVKISKIKSCSKRKDRLFGHGSQNDQDFKSLIHGCEKLNISLCDIKKFSSPSFLSARSPNKVQRSDSSNVGTSCSTQARMNTAPPCDVTIDELASYFETLVHIPKKMSSMAEMMYI
ncbi:uncharacterized protein LOC123311880 [Coccinella septempunctata]|uniref:uncharacterized protein LOC123311880 n=1 Tax=Coccinella septempunctata TaxID=41139 RepID=UPI001D097A81|nr:uncharacterized protein LOC123311880 [Coccinella septempunctata]